MLLRPNVESITEEGIESNRPMIGKIPSKGVSFSDFICIFAMPCWVLSSLFCNTKIGEIPTWQYPGPLGSAAWLVQKLIVAQDITNNIKLKRCGIKDIL